MIERHAASVIRPRCPYCWIAHLLKVGWAAGLYFGEEVQQHSLIVGIRSEGQDAF